MFIFDNGEFYLIVYLLYTTTVDFKANNQDVINLQCFSINSSFSEKFGISVFLGITTPFSHHSIFSEGQK